MQIVFIKNLSMITKNKYSIDYISYYPFHKKYGENKTQEELEKEGYLLELPIKKEIEGKIPVLYYNPVEKKLFYEYETLEDFSTKEETKDDDLQERVNALEKSNGEMMALITTLAMPKM